MTTAEIRALREKIIIAIQAERSPVLKPKELVLLEHTLRSLIIWREWLVPHD